MLLENQTYSAERGRKFCVEVTLVMLKQDKRDLRVQQTLWVSHEQLGGRSVWIDRETLDSLMNFARLGDGGSLGLTSTAFAVLDFFDVWTDATPVGIRLSADNEFFVHPYSSVEAELFDEAAALHEAFA